MILKRATKEQERAARRAQILDAAICLFETHAWNALTVAAIAKEAGLAKGTVYLYFKTKEQMFLELIAAQLQKLFVVWSVELAKAETAEEAVNCMVDTLIAEPITCRLTALLDVVVEHNVSPEAIVVFKLGLAQQMAPITVIFERWVLPEQGGVFLLRFHALMIGCFHAFTPSESAKVAFERDERIAGFNREVYPELRICAQAVMSSMTRDRRYPRTV